MTNETICKECNESFNNPEQVRRHLRKHQITFQQYSLKWYHNGIIPKCKCGCLGDSTWNVGKKSYTDFVHGHHAFGRIKSDDEKQKIGKANSINMKRFMNENKDIAQLKSKQMCAGHTPETEAKRIKSTKHTYEIMSPKDKQKFSDHAKKLWNSSDIMKIAHIKASKTFVQRNIDGLYDFTERNNKLSISITNKYLKGGFEWSRGSYTSTKTNKQCYYRSSWELLLMKELDLDLDVLDWESEFVSIPYEFEGNAHRYIPDFHVIRKSLGHSLIEVKPQALRITPRNTIKREVAKNYCKLNGWSYIEWAPKYTKV